MLLDGSIELGELLRDSLFTRAETSVLTSATLTTRKRFDFLRGRLGIKHEELADTDAEVEVREDIVMSPFDFADQTLLAIPTDLPSASGSSWSGGFATPSPSARPGATRASIVW